MEPTESSDMDKAPKGGASESIEVHVNAFYQESYTRSIKEAAFPAGMEPTGVERHGRQP
jgi:hypothetical protein